MTDIILSVRNLSKRYPGIQALDAVSLDVGTGTVHALVGENGAGKSTLIKCLAGVVHADHADIRINGKTREIHNTAESSEAGLAFIHQELNLVEYFNAAENAFLGHPLPKRRGLYSRRILKERASAIFDVLGEKIPPDEPVRYLSPGQRAKVAIARAFARDAGIYFMDEPATALTPHEKERLFEMIRRLTDRGKSVVYVTHSLDDVLSISDEITVLREGLRVAHRKTSDTRKRDLISAMIGREAPIDGADGSERHKTTDVSVDSPPVLAVDNLVGAGIGPVSFTLKAGEILGIGGLVGSGRSTLLKLLIGAVSAQSGRFTIRGREIPQPRSPEVAAGNGIVLIPEERRSQGLALQRSVFENAVVGGLRRFSRFGILDFKSARSAVRNAGERVRLKTVSYADRVSTLSGGNQQKALFGRAVLSGPKVLLLDEPTKGVDVGARSEIYDVIQSLAGDGVAVIVVSSDFEEILRLSDRIVFLTEGLQGSTLRNSEMSRNEYLTLCYEGVSDE